ncbi:MAG: hypothetical protein HY246_24345 [Proteobacteria bacterium]|nr:hypothetical protein [Pseudomonadota bacterium]
MRTTEQGTGAMTDRPRCPPADQGSVVASAEEVHSAVLVLYDLWKRLRDKTIELNNQAITANIRRSHHVNPETPPSLTVIHGGKL